MQPRLKPGFYARALIRRAEVAGAHGYILRKGAEEAGAVIVRLLVPDGNSSLFTQARAGAESELVWMRPLGDAPGEEAVAAFLEKQARIDPDLWIVEIEDREGRHFLDEKVL